MIEIYLYILWYRQLLANFLKSKILLLASIFALLTSCSGKSYYESSDKLDMFYFTFKAKAEKVFYGLTAFLNFNIPEDTTFNQFKESFINDNQTNSFGNISDDYHYFTTKDTSNKLDYYIIANDHTTKFALHTFIHSILMIKTFTHLLHFTC